MSSVLQLSVLNSQNPYMLKDKGAEPFTSAFTAVNGRGSPPTPRGPIALNTHQSPTQQHHEQRPPAENGYPSASPTSSSESSSAASSPDIPKRRKQSGSPEEGSSESRGMEAPQHRPLPPIDRSNEHERRWTTEPQQHNGYQEMRDPRPMDPVHGSMPPMAPPHGSLGEMNGFDQGNSADRSMGAVQHLDAKKRKRQFANRTKTGCGTCRKRKKKCDEAKPECTSILPCDTQERNSLANTRTR
jgi:hypothetical protein